MSNNNVSNGSGSLHCDPTDLALLSLGEEVDIDTEHLDSCAECTRETASLRRIARLSRQVTPQAATSPPTSVWTAIAQEMTSNSAITSSATDSNVIPMRQRKAPWIAMAAAVGVIVGSLVGVVATTDNVAPAPVVAQASLTPFPGFTTTGVANVTATESGEVLAVDLSDLPPANDGYFEVWLIAEDATSMISLGAVNAGQNTQLPIPAGLALDRYRLVDVSAEKFDGDVTHSTISVVRGELSV
jgi:hypothetical protein